MVRTDKAVNARLSLYPPEGDTTYAPTVQLQLALLIGRKAGKIGGDSTPVRSSAPLFQTLSCCTRTIRGLMSRDKWMT